MSLLKRIGLFLLAGFLTWLLLSVTGVPVGSVKHRVVRVLLLSGSLVFFLFSPFPTGSDLWRKSHWITNPDPANAWPILGIMLWISGAICFFAMEG